MPKTSEMPFSFEYTGKKDGREGQMCRLVSAPQVSHTICAVEFEDGHRLVCSRGKLKRRKDK